MKQRYENPDLDNAVAFFRNGAAGMRDSMNLIKKKLATLKEVLTRKPTLTVSELSTIPAETLETLCKILGHKHPPTDAELQTAIDDPDAFINRWPIKKTADKWNAHGARHVLRAAELGVWESLTKNFPNHIPTNDDCDGEYREYWKDVVLPECKKTYPDDFPSLADPTPDPWRYVREHIEAFHLWVKLIEAKLSESLAEPAKAKINEEERDSDEDYKPAVWFRQQTGIQPERLRVTAKRGQLPKKMLGKRHMYHVPTARKLWPQDFVDLDKP